jgi:hypothetical protein
MIEKRWQRVNWVARVRLWKEDFMCAALNSEIWYNYRVQTLCDKGPTSLYVPLIKTVGKSEHAEHRFRISSHLSLTTESVATGQSHEICRTSVGGIAFSCRHRTSGLHVTSASAVKPLWRFLSLYLLGSTLYAFQRYWACRQPLSIVAHASWLIFLH